MARKLKVWGYFGGAWRYVVATTTKKEALKVFSISAYEANNYMCETGNVGEIELALSEPGQVWRQSNRKSHEPWERVVSGEPWKLL